VHQDAFLLLTTPYAQILQPIDQAEGFIQDRIDDLLGVTRYGILLILAAVVALAFAFARTVSRPMQILAEGAQRLAEGQFDTRVEIKSSDEFGEMGKVFNEVGPQLEAHARFQQTMELAREVQQNFLPRRPPNIPGLDIAGKSQYCDEIGGDYFDFIDPDDGSNRIGVVIGDVSGHGIPSALLMTTARALLRQRVSLSGSIRQVIADVNVRLCRDIEESGQFMTLFYAEMLPDENAFRWLRAGHDPALLYHPDTDQYEELMGEGTTLGVSCDVRFEEYRQAIHSGQILLLSTDGIREARDPDGRMFGTASIRQILRTHAQESADYIVAAIMAELETFIGPQAKLEDDVTLVVVKVE
jgi:sigma-B regulation protein RsbU (phosphoserine phosphatase)